jgi:hypothetical protein
MLFKTPKIKNYYVIIAEHLTLHWNLENTKIYFLTNRFEAFSRMFTVFNFPSPYSRNMILIQFQHAVLQNILFY